MNVGQLFTKPTINPPAIINLFGDYLKKKKNYERIYLHGRKNI
jgi:hypothetical protein